MHEGPPEFEDKENEALTLKMGILRFGVELSDSREILSFPDIDPEIYKEKKLSDAEFPEYSTPIDVLLERFKNEGMKVVLGKRGGEILVLPAKTDETNDMAVMEDCLLLSHLEVAEGMDERLKELILKSKEFKNKGYGWRDVGFWSFSKDE